MSEQTQSQFGLFALGAIAALVMAMAVFLFLPRPDAVGVTASDDAMVRAGDTAPPPLAQVAPGPVAPVFDTFRVETDGRMVVAGRAEPGQVVDIVLGGEVLERLTADASGSFAAFPVAGPSNQPRRLSLVADPEGAATRSDTSYMVAPIARPQAVARASASDGTRDAAETSPAGTVEEARSDTPTAPAVPTDEVPVVPPAPTVLQADAEGIRVIQGAPQLATPEVAGNVALDAITYDPAGDVQLSGRATGEGSVQVYIDNQPVVTSRITDQRDFRIDLPEIDTGVYTLRIDELDPEGDVVSRIETPFKREEAANVAAVLAEETAQDGFEVAVRTVQPGMTLWAIAEENLGNGIFYVEVFEANADLIRDPDLIYPGQIFRIPDINQ